jgi:4-diphosphocytidyl-2-C-methyl-D-erythritol kinase
MAKKEYKTPAKINLGLYVTEKRQDGFHNIETIFYPVNLSDKITIEDSDQFSFSSNKKSLPNDSTNLVVHAKYLLEEYSGEKINIKIHLEKNIPVGAGLGGGSSDAASTLKFLNEFAGLKLSRNEIFDLALSLGSDVPFFLNPQPSFAYGRGEILEPLLIHIDLPIVIVNPDIQISTAWAYSLIKANKATFNLRKIDSLDLYNLRLLPEKVKNVFEEPVFDKYPEIKELKHLHYKLGALYSSMSGSGSTVFGIYADDGSAFTAASLMKDQGYFVFTHNEKQES